uniref:Ribonuclease A-domain domain-containing protein n=1 Tax=Fundulus heteroclitus TaxID=8078 RepID=A0A3Q2Q8U6_FUNHE
MCETMSSMMNQTSTPAPIEDTLERYQKFKRQHIDKKMTDQKCTAVMKQKRIYDKNNSCKEKNTFILAAEKEVKSICNGQDVNNKQSELRESKKRFRLVVCNLRNQASKPKCEYRGTCHTNRIIVVSCVEGLPVHYEGDHI